MNLPTNITMSLTTAIITAAIVAVTVLIVSIAMRPPEFRVKRSIVINAPPEIIFPQVNDLHNWEKWSPWAKKDPLCKITFSGAPAGTGASYVWAGNKKVGSGRMTITDSAPPTLVRIKLEFEKPFKAVNTTEFTFTPQGGQTTVVWSMVGKSNFFFKAMQLVVNMDKMIGGDFEQGLAQMKVVAEAAARVS